MTVPVKNRTPVIIPPAALRRAGFKSGQELEVKASGGVITIVLKLSPDEQQDERDIRDPKIRAVIRKGHEEFLAGKTRPAERLLAERGNGVLKKPRRMADPDDTLTPAEEKIVRRGLAQLKRGESKPWRVVKHALSL
jgi:antitoxin component of MazEF toxin-antitoxin module